MDDELRGLEDVLGGVVEGEESADLGGPGGKPTPLLLLLLLLLLWSWEPLGRLDIEPPDAVGGRPGQPGAGWRPGLGHVEAAAAAAAGLGPVEDAPDLVLHPNPVVNLVRRSPQPSEQEGLVPLRPGGQAGQRLHCSRKKRRASLLQF